MIRNSGMAALVVEGPLEAWEWETCLPAEDEVLVRVLFCGICHTDIHMVQDDWADCPSVFPLVPGHEITGVVESVGTGVRRFKSGDRIGIGLLVGSCGDCEHCAADLENFCPRRVFTFNGEFPERPGRLTTGGYGRYVLTKERFGIVIAPEYPLEKVGPLLCAGVTTYSALVQCGVKTGGLKIGIVGIGGLGHMAVQFARAFGNEVIAFAFNTANRDLALRLGASDLFASNDPSLKTQTETFDVILSTVPNTGDVDLYVDLLKPHGTLIALGLPEKNAKTPVSFMQLISRSRTIRGSLIGGIKETQEMMDFCVQQKIYPMIEMCSLAQVNEAYERIKRGDVKFRFVIDMAASPS